MRLLAGLLAGLLTGCTTSLGTIGVVRRDSDDVAVKLLRPGVTGRSCGSSVLGVPVSGSGPDVRDALERILVLDAEGDVIVNAEVTSHAFISGVYNRRCVEVRGDLARTTSTIILPAPMGHHGH